MNNKEIAEKFKLLAKVMELYGENSFKIKAYSNAAFRISKLGKPLSESDLEDLNVPGIGTAIKTKIAELLDTGELPLLAKYLTKTPEGVMEMLSLKGLGAKKIALLWHELGIESLGELAYACEENRLIKLKGFGEKTQAATLENIRFLQKYKDFFLYSDGESYAQMLLSLLNNNFPNYSSVYTGAFRRQLPVLECLELVTEIPASELESFLGKQEIPIISASVEEIQIKEAERPKVIFYLGQNENIPILQFRTTNSSTFSEAFSKKYIIPENPQTEKEIFLKNALAYIPPALREDERYLLLAEKQELPQLIQVKDIKGLIHSHSQYSDGINTLEEMAAAAKEKGFAYMVISDHSQTAVYAQGLRPDRVLEQQSRIDHLNKIMAPFRIFKSIESDILSDGSLDYEDEILKTFDLVIASVHSQLKMDEEKAMLRLIRAVENPYTTILGHPTGRLLLSRPAYPVQHRKLVDACAANKVTIEINAHPRRLDLDWQWIPYALEKGVMLSINPDAHSIEGIDLIKYGVLAAQKAGLTAANNLSSKNLKDFEAFLNNKK